jgi:hypothetical protein
VPTWRARARRHALSAHPWAVWVCALCLLNGIPLLLGAAPPDSIEATLPPWGRIAWGVVLTVGSAAVLAGMFWPGSDTDALLVELVGMLAVGVGCVVYASALLTLDGSPAPRSGVAIIGGFGVACLWRVWAAERTLRTMERLTARRALRRDRRRGERS